MLSDLTVLGDAPAASKIDLEKFVKVKLPSIPETTMRVLTLLRDINTPLRKLAEAVGCDPSLTTRVLRFANSPLYAQQKNVSSLQQAVGIVGAKYLYDIAMMNLTANAFASEIKNFALGRTIWEHSIAVALVARELSRMLELRGTEEVFICGLLHDIGKIMLLRADPEIYVEVLDKTNEWEMLDWEAENFGYNHAQIGAFVTSRWQLPEMICHSILNHHETERAVEAKLLSYLINVADSIANARGYGLRGVDENALASLPSTIALRLDANQLETAWENIQTDLMDIAKMFN